MTGPTFDKALHRLVITVVTLHERQPLDSAGQALFDQALAALDAQRGRAVAEAFLRWLTQGQVRFDPRSTPDRVIPDAPLSRRRFSFDTEAGKA